MFSKELESLIQATLEDGILEDYEKAALVKRAEAEGVDLTELEIYINSILQRRKRELAKEQDAQQAVIDQKKKEAFGRVCPNCRKQVPPLTIKCDCGYEFTKSKSVSSMQMLTEKLNAVSLARDEIEEIEKAAPAEQDEKRANFLAEKKIGIINTFPVPNTKDDIIEFLAVSVSSANKKLGLLDTKKGFLFVFLAIIIICLILTLIIPLIMAMIDFIVVLWGLIIFGNKKFTDEKICNAWRVKSEQVLMKGRSLRGDPEFTQQLDYYENILNKK